MEDWEIQDIMENYYDSLKEEEKISEYEGKHGCLGCIGCMYCLGMTWRDFI
jgi:hypothetical protein